MYSSANIFKDIMTHGKDEKCVQNYLKRRGHVGSLGIDRKIILISVLKK
jgi:hypothetical protein